LYIKKIKKEEERKKERLNALFVGSKKGNRKVTLPVRVLNLKQ